MNIEKIEKLLPVGTIVRLKDGIKTIMVTGFFPVSGDDNKMYDYSACFYPEGLISSEINMLFNHEQVDEIIYPGYNSKEDADFKSKLKEYVANNADEIFAQNNNSVNAEQPVEIPMMQQAAPMVDLSDVSQMVETLEINNQN